MGQVVTKIEFHYPAFTRVRQSAGVAADLKRRGDAIAAAAGDGVGVRVAMGASRARVTVITETYAAAKAEATDKTLTSAIGAGRG
jgi:hypothetical protein